MKKTTIQFISGILVLAIIAVIISKNARTSQVIQSFASAFSNILGVVVGPISGNSANVGDATPGVAIVTTTKPAPGETGNTNQSPADPGPATDSGGGGF
jgi:hypothetical protein